MPNGIVNPYQQFFEGYSTGRSQYGEIRVDSVGLDNIRNRNPFDLGHDTGLGMKLLLDGMKDGIPDRKLLEDGMRILVEAYGTEFLPNTHVYRDIVAAGKTTKIPVISEDYFGRFDIVHNESVNALGKMDDEVWGGIVLRRNSPVIPHDYEDVLKDPEKLKRLTSAEKGELLGHAFSTLNTVNELSDMRRYESGTLHRAAAILFNPYLYDARIHTAYQITGDADRVLAAVLPKLAENPLNNPENGAIVSASAYFKRWLSETEASGYPFE